MGITLQEFLRRKGAIGLLSLLHERPMTYSEIEPEIEVTSDTIITRRDEAASLGLLDISLGEGDVGTTKVYHLTDMGEFLTDKMAREGLISNYRKMRTLEQLVDQETRALVRWVSENPSQLLQFEEADGTIIQDKSQTDPSPSDETDADGDAAQHNATDAGEDDPGDATAGQVDADLDDSTDGEDPTEVTEDENEDGESRPDPPSASVRDELEELDPSDTTQGSFSDVESTDSTEEEPE